MGRFLGVKSGVENVVGEEDTRHEWSQIDAPLPLPVYITQSAAGCVHYVSDGEFRK